MRGSRRLPLLLVQRLRLDALAHTALRVARALPSRWLDPCADTSADAAAVSVLPCPSAAASDHGVDDEAADGTRDVACDELLEAAAASALLDASPTATVPIVSEDMAIDSDSHGCTAAAATLQDDEAGPAIPAETDGIASAPHCAELTMAALSAAAALRRDDSELTPYQHTASPAACVQPAAETESESDSDWWERQLPAAACRSALSAVPRRGVQLSTTSVAAVDSRKVALRRGAAVLMLAKSDVGR